MAIIKIADPDSGETEEREECRTCGGSGGWDRSTDCEAYDDWEDCPDCKGRGWVEPGHFDRDRFVPGRDAFKAGD